MDGKSHDCRGSSERRLFNTNGWDCSVFSECSALNRCLMLFLNLYIEPLDELFSVCDVVPVIELEGDGGSGTIYQIRKTS